MKVWQQGFSLLELMIVVAVIGILAMIALPSYQDQLEKGRREEGRAALLTIAQAQERFYTANGSYATSVANLALSEPLPDITGTATENGYYTLTTTGGATFTATANTAGSQTGDDDECAIFTLNNLGVKHAADSGGTDTTTQCWK